MIFIEQELPSPQDTVVVGMSGGVDSTLTALLLQQRGCRVIGATMSLWDGSLQLPTSNNAEKSSSKPRESCFAPGEQDSINECADFCAEHGIEYHVVDVKEAYKREVLEYFKAEYRAGRTPNPCVRCNRFIKFGALLEGIRASGIDFDFFCTGHYAKVVRPEEGIFGTQSRPFMISKASDALKDQTYFLYRLPSDILRKTRFPLASLKKSDVFTLARQSGIKAASRAESQDFISAEYFDLLFADKPSQAGDIIDLDGRVLGRHRGIEHYTIGQRRGLGVSVNYPVYVHSIDAERNVVVLAPESALFSTEIIAGDFVWAGGIEPQTPIEADVKIRLASPSEKALIERCDSPFAESAPSSASSSCRSSAWKITFKSPQRAAAPGQSAVLYQDNTIIGGGIISKTI